MNSECEVSDVEYDVQPADRADFPVQTHQMRMGDAKVPRAVNLAAYEVYCHVHGAQPAMVQGHCRSGFSAGELIAYLYARSFPKDQWRQRANEAFAGMTAL